MNFSCISVFIFWLNIEYNLVSIKKIEPLNEPNWVDSISSVSVWLVNYKKPDRLKIQKLKKSKSTKDLEKNWKKETEPNPSSSIYIL